MDEIILRFPHLAEQIFRELDNKSVAKCRDTNRLWQAIINRDKSYKQRITKMIEDSKKKAKQHYYKIKGFTPLHLAALNGQTQMVMDLIDRQGEKNPSEKFQELTPLHLAARAGFSSVCHIIIKNIDLENINPKDKRGVTPLHLAAKSGLFSVCKLIIDNVRDKNPKDHHGRTPLHHATDHHCEYIIANENRNPKADFEKTPFHLATTFESICHLIIENIETDDMNPMSSHKYGTTPLHLAVSSGLSSVAKLIIDKVSDKNPKDFRGNTPLHHAASNGQVDVCQYIFEKVQDKNPINKDGETPLHFAAQSGQLATFKVLMANIQDMNIETKSGHTPLHSAAIGGHLEVYKYISEYIDANNSGTNQLSKNTDMKRTPLHLAASGGHMEICKFIMGNLIDKNPKSTDDGWTPLHCAASRGQLKVCQLLMKHIYNKNPEANDGTTPLQLAAKSGSKCTIKWFNDVMKKFIIPTNQGFAPNYPSAKKIKFN